MKNSRFSVDLPPLIALGAALVLCGRVLLKPTAFADSAFPERRRRAHQKRLDSKPRKAPEKGPRESVDEFLARGGRIRRLTTSDAHGPLFNPVLPAGWRDA